MPPRCIIKTAYYAISQRSQKMKLTKILSALLAAVILISVCVTGVYAAEKLPFTDVPEGEWYYDAVAYTFGEGLMNGTGDGSTFSPTMNLTRGMVVTVLYRNDGSPDDNISNPFADVAHGAWYEAAAAWAYDSGVVTGTGTDEWGEPLFSPDRNITRQELAAMFARYAAYKHVDTTKNTSDISKFPDSGSVASWAEKEFKWTAGTGIITGKTNGGAATLSPEDLATRAEFAIMIQRYNVKDDAREFTYNLAYETPVIKNSYTEPEYPLVKDADIYVSVDGNDKNDGSIDKPLATFAAAKAKVQEIKKSKTSGEIKVAFKGGDYGALNNVQFTSEDGGNENLKITYCAYGDSPVYFTGGVFIGENEFTSLSDSEKALFDSKVVSNIKKVDLSASKNADRLDASSMLFNANGFCTAARYPNKVGDTVNYIAGSIVQQIPLPGHTHEELMEICKTTGDQELLKTVTEQKKVTALAQFKAQLNSYASLDGVMICGNISKIWHADNLDIESYDKSTGIITFKQSPQYGFVNYDENYASVYISGASVDLDCDGEYWFDAKTKTLYVYKPNDQYLMGNQDTFITMERADNIAFVKLNFRGATDTSIKIAYCNGFTFDMGTLLYSGGTYGFEADECINVKITNSELAYFANEGLHITSPTSEHAIKGYHPDALMSDGLVIDNNSIHDIGITTVGVDTSGIRLNRTVKSQITHNEIYNSNRCAIRFDDCIMTDIAYNYFHHCMLNSADGGVVYGFRSLTFRDNNVRYNLFTDIPNKTGVQYAIYNDGAHAWNIYGNIFYGAAAVNVVLNGGRDNYVYENVCINSGDPKSGFMLYNSDMIDEEYSDDIKIGPEDEVAATFDRLKQKPENGEPYYDEWYEKWPLIYDFFLDFEDISKGEQCIYYTVNHIKNNYLFDMSCNIDEGSIADKFGEFEGNLELTTDTNDYFTDPTHGDYSPAKGVSMPNNHFDKIGRY